MGLRNSKPELRDEDLAMLCKTSGLGEEAVREQFDAFVLHHPDGKMKKEDFKNMLAKAMPDQDASKIEKHMFRIYDANDDGHIDAVEFMVIYHIMADGSPQEVLAKLFRVFDVNSDGSITEKEMARLIKDLFILIKSDAPEEATKEFISKSTFAEMDEDGNGKVTAEEFAAACLAQDQFSKMLALKVIDIFLEDE